MACRSDVAVFDILDTEKPCRLCWTCIKHIVRFYNRFISLSPEKPISGV